MFKFERQIKDILYISFAKLKIFLMSIFVCMEIIYVHLGVNTRNEKQKLVAYGFRLMSRFSKVTFVTRRDLLALIYYC